MGHRLNARGFVAGTSGNLSARLDDGRILVTPSGMSKGELTVRDLVVVDSLGRSQQGTHPATSELAMHLAVYEHRADVGACVHSHPPYTTAFAVAGLELAGDILPEVVLFVGKIILTEYAPPGTKAVAEAIRPHLATANAFVLRNHGLLTLGCNLRQACDRHEAVEHLAQTVWLARQLGNVGAVPPADLRRLDQMRRRSNQAAKRQNSRQK